MRLFRLALLLLVLPLPALAQLPDPLFPVLREATGGAPLVPIAQQTWGADAEEPKEGPRNLVSDKDPDAPFADRTLFAGEFRARPGKGPARLVLDYAGFETEPIKRGDRDNWIVFNIALKCPFVEGGKCLGERLPKTQFQNLFETRPDYVNSMKRTPVKVAGRERILLTGTEVFEYDAVPEELMKFFFSFNAPANVETHQVRATLLYGDFTTAAPQAAKADAGESKSPGFLLKLLIFVALAVAAFLGIKALARRMSE
ncbi:MAG: hypothetical protein IPL06_12345 [Betaproteobacteria bacterium]|nr:hypothetical protein [Betaproteobacteria bacterium]